MEKHAFIRHHSFGEVECTGNCACLHMLLCAKPRFASTRFIRLPLVASFALGSVSLGHFAPGRLALGRPRLLTLHHSLSTFHGPGHPCTPVGGLTPVGSALIRGEDGISGNSPGIFPHFRGISTWFLSLSWTGSPKLWAARHLMGADRRVLGRLWGMSGAARSGSQRHTPTDFLQIANTSRSQNSEVNLRCPGISSAE
jgi:hypothetical protein